MMSTPASRISSLSVNSRLAFPPPNRRGKFSEKCLLTRSKVSRKRFRLVRLIRLIASRRLWILDQEPGTNDDLWSYDFAAALYQTLGGSDFVDPQSLAFSRLFEVPALGPWGRALLAGLLGLAGVGWGRRAGRGASGSTSTPGKAGPGSRGGVCRGPQRLQGARCPRCP